MQATERKPEQIVWPVGRLPIGVHVRSSEFFADPDEEWTLLEFFPAPAQSSDLDEVFALRCSSL